MNTGRIIQVALITTFPAPYRIPLLNRLSTLAGIALTVLVVRSGNRTPDSELAALHVPYQIFGAHTVYLRDRHGDRVGFVTSPALWSHLRRVKYDAIVALGWTMPNTLLARLNGALLRTPTILWDESIPHPPGKLKKTLSPLLRRYFGSFDGYLAASSWCREYMISMGAAPERVVVFPQVADNSFFKQQAEHLRAQREEIKRAIGISTCRVILFVGQLIPRKGVRTLLDAFEQIAAQDADVSLVLVGKGVLRAELEARRAASPFAERLFIQPFAAQAELPKYYALADIFVLPSFYDTFGVVVNEAMASSLPVVTTHNVGAVANLVEDGVNGRIVAPGDAAQLAQALTHLLKDEELRQKMGANALARIEQWTIEDAAHAFIECLTRCLKARQDFRPHQPSRSV
jgi:glycosyltransferase involved in cell wall biosynthesis